MAYLTVILWKSQCNITARRKCVIFMPPWGAPYKKKEFIAGVVRKQRCETTVNLILAMSSINKEHILELHNVLAPCREFVKQSRAGICLVSPADLRDQHLKMVRLLQQEFPAMFLHKIRLCVTVDCSLPQRFYGILCHRNALTRRLRSTE